MAYEVPEPADRAALGFSAPHPSCTFSPPARQAARNAALRDLVLLIEAPPGAARAEQAGCQGVSQSIHFAIRTSCDSIAAITSTDAASICTHEPWISAFSTTMARFPLHEQRPCNPEPFLRAVQPCMDNLVVTAELHLLLVLARDLCE